MMLGCDTIRVEGGLSPCSPDKIPEDTSHEFSAAVESEQIAFDKSVPLYLLKLCQVCPRRI